MIHLIFTAALAFEARAFTERFTCARDGASLVNVVVRGRGNLPVMREIPVTARIAEVTIDEEVARDVLLQGWANMSASGTYFELDTIHTPMFSGLMLSSFGPAALIDREGRRLALDCGGGADALFQSARIDEGPRKD